MEDALRAGKARSIGVSNFTVAHLEALKATATIWPPAVNQVEQHPLLPYIFHGAFHEPHMTLT